MQGSLKHVPLPEVLQFLSMGKSSGVLRLKRNKSEITLSIANGKIINSSAIDRRRRIGDLLVNRGLLKRSELTRLLNLQKTVESDKRLGQILVERDIVTEETIRETLRLQLEEEIWNLFSWQDGDFAFEQLETADLGDAIVQIDIEPLILEGTRRNDEWQKILTIIPNDRMVLEPGPVSDEFERHLKLRPHEWQVLAQVNGRFSVRAIVNRSNLGRFEVFLILSHFIKSGLLRFKTSTKEEGEAEEQGPPAGGNGHHPPTAAEKAATTGAEKTRGGLLGGLIGGGKPREKTSARDNLEFVSPIGALAHLINHFARKVMDQKEFARTPADSDLLDRIWFDLVQIYTKADLITVHENHVDVRLTERYLQEAEFAECLDEMYEDAHEGLTHLLQTAHTVFAQRAGERTVSKAIRELVEDMSGRMTIKYRGPFPLAEKMQTVLRVG